MRLLAGVMGLVCVLSGCAHLPERVRVEVDETVVVVERPGLDER